MGNGQRKMHKNLGTEANSASNHNHANKDNDQSKELKENSTKAEGPPKHPNLLTEEALGGKHPLEIFKAWMMEAFQTGEPDPFFMNLATATSCGKPSVRLVALGDSDERGLYFATVDGTQKVKEIKENPRAAVCFYWSKLQRTIRIEGIVEECENNEEPFKRWPKPFQVGMRLAGAQGKPVEDWESAEKKLQEEMAKFGDQEVPQPEHVTTYVIIPTSVQFMQLKQTSLSDRFIFTKKDPADEGSWSFDRVYP